MPDSTEQVDSRTWTRRYLTGQVIPGSRIVATGVYSTFQSSKSGAVRLRVLLLSTDREVGAMTDIISLL